MGSSKKKGPWREMKAQRGEEGVEIMTDKEGKVKKRCRELLRLSFDGRLAEEVRGSLKSCSR